ncbi:MAG: aldo/keto reductase [Deltaproteobacteria bacterium]|nr:aldo/keto reductase [Deltaproteobacteria bacterium]
MSTPADIPPFLYGTAWKEERTEALVEKALAAGFRGIDTANQRKHYHEAGVGAALAKAFTGGMARDELFLQTKFTFRGGQDHRLPYDPDAATGEQVRQSFDRSLEHLGVERIDSLVLHGPSRREGLGPADERAWRAMEAIHGEGRVRFIGLSNVSASQLDAFIELAEVAPTFVQNRCYASRGWDAAVRQRCDGAKIVYQGFSLLTANRDALARDSVKAIARAHGVTVPQVVFAFARQLGMLPLTGTSDPQHMRQDLDSLQLTLGDDELRTIETVGL